MKKTQLFSTLFLAMTFAVSFTGFPRTQTAEAATSEIAEYVSIENAPVIDGIIDEAWFYSTSMITTDVSPDGTYGDIYILWNERGLYFLAEVVDYTLNKSDLCNFWVSEVYQNYNVSSAYQTTDGAYYLCLNSQGTNVFYNPNTSEYVDMEGKYTVETSLTDKGYILELFVPTFGKTPLQKGASIGFDVSIDDYYTESVSIDYRKSYVNWNGTGPYWSNPTALGEILLMDLTSENGSPNEIKPDDETNDSNDANNDSSNNTDNNPHESSSNSSSSTTNPDNSFGENSDSTNELFGGCFSVASIGSLALSAIFCSLLFSKKRKS